MAQELTDLIFDPVQFSFKSLTLTFEAIQLAAVLLEGNQLLEGLDI